MKKTERISITRVFYDLIKADAVIDAGEMAMYAQFKEKYSITNEIEKAAIDITLADAVAILSQMDESVRSDFLSDCAEMTISDGFCDPTEAIIMLALTSCLNYPREGYAEIISAYEPNLKIGKSQVIYVECKYDEFINAEIFDQYRNIINELKTAGFNFVYIPKVAEHYKQYNQTIFNQVASFLAPNLSDGEVQELILHLTEMTTVQFCKEQLIGRLEMNSIQNIAPSLLFKISSNYVSGKLYGNFLRIEVGSSIVQSIQNLIDQYKSMLSSDVQVISNVEEKEGQFLYHGFYMQLFDMYTIRHGVIGSVEINPYKGVIRFPEINKELSIKRKEKAFYVLMLLLSMRGGVSFNKPSSAKQMALYQKRMSEIRVLYSKIYELFGGERNEAPNIELSDIRGPIVSNIRKNIKSLINELRNADDYTIIKDEQGVFSIPLPSKLVKILTINGLRNLDEVEL